MALGEGLGSPILRTTLDGLWTENCKVGGLCGRGTLGGSSGQMCDTSNGKKNDRTYCGQCKYGWRHPTAAANDWCCTWNDFTKNKDCKCQAEYAPECAKKSSITETGESNDKNISIYKVFIQILLKFDNLINKISIISE